MQLKKLLMLVPLIAGISYLKSQNVQLHNLSINEVTGLPRYAEIEPQHQMPVGQFFTWFLKQYQFPKDVTFKELRTDIDEIGFTHTRYKQYFQGIEVLHSMLILHIKNGLVESFNGDYFKNFSSPNFLLTPEQAREIAIKAYGVNAIPKWKVPSEEDFIKAIKHDSTATWYPKNVSRYISHTEYYDGKTPLTYCYAVDVAFVTPRVHHQVLVNALNGDIFRTIPLEVHTDTSGSAVTHYEGTKKITADLVGSNSFRLRENGKRNVETYKTSLGTDYTDADNYWNNGTDKIAGDVHYGAETVSDFMKKFFNKNSYDGKGGALVSVNTSGSGNAYWNLGSNYATFLVGSSSTVGPCAALDVVGHEFGHGIADEISGLVYSGEGCQLHESFADINGHNTEFMNDSLTANWYIGDKVWPTRGIRYMRNPHIFNHPKAYGGVYYPSACHGSGGVQNYWYYIQVAGDTGKNEFNYNYSLKGLGHWKAAQILYRSMFYYMVPNGKFKDQYIGTIKSAKDLYGSCSPELEHTYRAWKVVNVEDTSVKTVDLSHGINAPTLLCNGAPTTATLSSFGDISRKTFWEINNTDTSSKKSYSYTFNKTGSYKVKLTTNTCTKVFGDSMYITVNYKPNPTFVKPFDSICLSKDKYTFTNTTKNADTKIPLKYYWYINPGAYYDTTKDLKIAFPDPIDYEITLKAYYEGGCWTLSKQNMTVLSAPKPAFLVVKDVCEAREVRLRNLSDTVTNPINFQWIFPDNSVYNGFEPKNKSIPTAGKYNVILKGIYNQAGGCSDTAMRPITIMANPKPDFTFSNNCKNLEMAAYAGGTTTAPKRWNQWHFGTYFPVNKDSIGFPALDSNTRTIGFTLGDSNGCYWTKFRTIVLGTLEGNITAKNACFKDSNQIQLQETHTGSLTQLWDLGDGGTKSGNLTAHKYNAVGKYNISVLLKNENCSTKLYTTTLVMPSPTTDFNSNNVCDGDSVRFVNKTPNEDSANFYWNLGDNITSSLKNPVYLYPTGVTRTMNIFLEATGKNGCKSSKTKQVTITEIPTCNFQADLDITGNNGFNFTPTSGSFSEYRWYFGDGDSSTQKKPFHRYKANSKYTVKLVIYSNAYCKCELTKEVNAQFSGSNSVLFSTIKIYPNPVHDQLNILGANAYGYTVTNITGMQIASGKIDENGTIPVLNFASGIYVLTLHSNGNSAKFFFVKE